MSKGQQFVSAYTREDTEGIPQKGPSLHHSMQRIKVTISGVAKLLHEHKPYKATGSDSIPTLILKVAADGISHSHQFLDTGEVPLERMKANILSLFKNGDRHQPFYYWQVLLTSASCTVPEHILHIQSNLSGSNIFGTMEIRSRHW